MSSSFTARSAHGSQPWRVTNFSSGKNQHTSSMSPTYCGANGTARPGHARAHVDRDVELDALGVDREELLVVDRHLRVEPARERAGRLHAELLDRAGEVAHRVHAAVGVHLHAAEEAVGMLAERPLGVFDARRLLAGGDADHGALDAVLVHQVEQALHGIRLRLDLRDVLEHVLRGELELVERLVVAQVGAEEVVVVTAVGFGKADHQVDHADVGRHGHGCGLLRAVGNAARATVPRDLTDRQIRGQVGSADVSDWGHASDFDDVRGEVAIVGIGETEYTKASGRTAREIGIEAAERAIADAGLEPGRHRRPHLVGRVPRLRRRTCSASTSARRTRCGRRPGAAAWRGPRPRPTSRRSAIREGKARHVLNVFPVAWATQRGSMTGGPGEVHAAQSLKQNLEVPFGWFPQPVYFATIMRRHMLEFGTTEEQFGAVARRVPAPRQPASGRGHARPADGHRRLPRRDDARRSAAAARLVPDLRRRRRVRDHEHRAGPRPPAAARGGARRRRGLLGRGRALGAAARVHEHARRSSPRRGAFAMAGRRAGRRRACSPCTTRSPW